MGTIDDKIDLALGLTEDTHKMSTISKVLRTSERNEVTSAKTDSLEKGIMDDDISWSSGIATGENVQEMTQAKAESPRKGVMDDDMSRNSGIANTGQNERERIRVIPSVRVIPSMSGISMRGSDSLDSFPAGNEAGVEGGSIIEFDEDGELKPSSSERVFDLSGTDIQHRIKCSISWKNLGYCLRGMGNRRKVSILDGKLSGHVNPKEICAVIGPSGSGKTTFLDVLARRKDRHKSSGTVMLNGRGVTASTMKHLSSYIIKHEVLMGALTIRENILYSAELCLAAAQRSTREALENRVDALIAEMGLTKVANRKVGTRLESSVSDGEIRRAGIACQLIALHPIIFMDEPTSGLDSVAAIKVVRYVQKIVRKYNLTVIMSVHQPSAELFDIYDKVLMLSEGRTLYFGDQDKMVDYFESHGHPCPTYRNPAQHYMKLASVNFGRGIHLDSSKDIAVHTLADKFEDNPEEEIPSYLRTMKLNMMTYERSYFEQTLILMRRGFVSASRNLFLYWLRLGVFALIAIIMGSTWMSVGFDQESVQDRFSAIFFSIVIFCSLSICGLPSMLEDQTQFYHEEANGMYSVAPFVIANTLVSLPYLFLIALVFTSITYPLVDLHYGTQYFAIFLGFIYLTICVAESLTIFISAVVPNFIGALTLVNVLNGIFLIVQGFFVRKSAIPDGWLWVHYMDYLKYAFEALVKNDFEGLYFNCRIPDNDETISDDNECFCYFPSSMNVTDCQFTGMDVLKEYEYDNIHLSVCGIALLVMMVVFRFSYYVILKVNRH